MQTKKHIQELHSEIQDWKSQLQFVKDTTQTLMKELAEVAQKNNHHEVTAQVESFQNRFIRQNEVCDELNHEVKQADKSLAEKAVGNPAADHVLVEDMTELRDRTETNFRLFSELRNEYQSFLSKVM